MTRLFLRFYLGVILILLMAGVIQGFVFRTRGETENLQVVEQALSGGVRLAIARIESAKPTSSSQTLRQVQSQFEYPVQVVSLSEQNFGSDNVARLKAGEVVFITSNRGGFVIGSLAERDQGLLFGPLPRFVGPSQADVTLGFGVVLLLAAVAIAILLRPVARQLRAVEKTATAIASGDLSARITTGKRKGLPLAFAFNSMAERTETLLNSQRELLQAVSHELRTPLARIRFAADLIGTADSEEERKHRLAAVDRATEELDELVSELLTYVGMEAPDPKRTEELLDPMELVSDVVASVQPLFQGVDFSVNHANSASISILGDRISLARAVSNLVRNAGKFAHEKVRIDIRQQGSSCVISVSDDGPGIPIDDRGRVFSPFVRLPDSPGRGTGLGLALVSRIVNHHQGGVSITDSELGGAQFDIQLPTHLRQEMGNIRG